MIVLMPKEDYEYLEALTYNFLHDMDRLILLPILDRMLELARQVEKKDV